jgi:hypothetical protein
MIPSADLEQPWSLEDMNGVQVLRLKAPRTKDNGPLRMIDLSKSGLSTVIRLTNFAETFI